MDNGKAGFTKPWGVDDGNLDNEGDRTSALSLGGKPVCRPFYSKAVLRRTYLLPAISVLHPDKNPERKRPSSSLQAVCGYRETAWACLSRHHYDGRSLVGLSRSPGKSFCISLLTQFSDMAA